MPAQITFTTRGALGKSALRKANERLALNAIRLNPSISRSDIGRITGLSPSSVTCIIKRLKARKLIVETAAENHRQMGRRPTSLAFRPEALLAIGVEVAPSGSRVILADPHGRII